MDLPNLISDLDFGVALYGRMVHTTQAHVDSSGRATPCAGARKMGVSVITQKGATQLWKTLRTVVLWLLVGITMVMSVVLFFAAVYGLQGADRQLKLVEANVQCPDCG